MPLQLHYQMMLLCLIFLTFLARAGKLKCEKRKVSSATYEGNNAFCVNISLPFSHKAMKEYSIDNIRQISTDILATERPEIQNGSTILEKNPSSSNNLKQIISTPCQRSACNLLHSSSTIALSDATNNFTSDMNRSRLKTMVNMASTSSPLMKTFNSVRNITNTLTADKSLLKLLLHLIQEEAFHCELVIGYRKNYIDPEFIHILSLMPNEIQILTVDSVDSFSSILWKSSKCRGYILLWAHLDSLLEFASVDLNFWDYHGKYIFVGYTLQELELIVSSKKGKKTEKIIGVIKSGEDDQWSIHMNQMFWGLGLKRINTWKNDRMTSTNDLFPDKTSDLRGITLKAVIFEWQPSVMLFRNSKGEMVSPYGLDIELMKTIGRVLNFSLVFVEPPKDERWGEFAEDGSLTGMVGLVHREEADMGSANLFVSITRVNHIDFSKFFDSEFSCVLLRTEPPLPSWQSLAFPFQLWTWFSIMVGLAFVGPILFLLANISRRFGDEIDNFRSLSYSWYYAFGMHLNEPQDQLPRRIVNQIFVAFLWLYCIIITIAYSTNLTAFLTIKKSPKGMETIEELPHSGVVVVGVDNYHQGMLKLSPDPNLRTMAETYQVHYDSKEVFRRVQSGKAIFIDNRGYLEYTILTKFTRRGVASLRIMKECFASHLIAMALHDHSPLKRNIDKVITRLLYGGLIRRFFLDALRLAAAVKKQTANTELLEKIEEDDGGIMPLSLDHMQGIFFIAIVGWVFSVLVFGFECIRR